MVSRRSKPILTEDERQFSQKLEDGIRKTREYFHEITGQVSSRTIHTEPSQSPSKSRTPCRDTRPATWLSVERKLKRKRTRSDKAENLVDRNPTQDPQKRQRKSTELPVETTSNQGVDAHDKSIGNSPVSHWVKEGIWPKELSEPGMTTMDRFVARKKSTPSLRRKRSEMGSTTGFSATSSDQKPREVKSKPYTSIRYKDLLATLSSFMDESEQGITDESERLCERLLDREQTIIQDSLFREDLFDSTCRAVQDRNEARILRDISPLIVPSAENLAIYGATELKTLVESINEGWNNSEPLTEPRPQPDYSVGFKRDTFTGDQLKKLSPYIGDFIAGDHSLLMATHYMYFPFLTCEVKCGAAALDIADRQNAHSMTLAVRGIVTLFSFVKRQQELHRTILAFSVSHDHRSVRIYGHYPNIERDEISYHRHLIDDFSFTAHRGRQKWTAYKFIKNVYKIWMPTHLARIRSVIDDIPVFQDTPLAEGSGISQNMESHSLSQSAMDQESLIQRQGNEVYVDDTTDPNPDNSFSGVQGAFKKARKIVKPK